MAPSPEKSWYKKVADTISREGVPIRQALSMHDIPIDAEEANQLYRSKIFQRVLWQARFDYYSQIASDPARTKAALLGLMTLAIQNLASEGQWDKVLEGALKVARVEGWANGESNVTVFANLTAKDIEKERARLLEGLEEP